LGLLTAIKILFGLLAPTQSYSGLTIGKPIIFKVAGHQTTITMTKILYLSINHHGPMARAIVKMSWSLLCEVKPPVRDFFFSFFSVTGTRPAWTGGFYCLGWRQQTGSIKAGCPSQSGCQFCLL
jgi:hypothetical protein